MCVAATSAAVIGLRATPTLAVPTTATSPGPGASLSPSPLPAGARTLPLDSSLLFVLDDRIGSKVSQPGTQARAHLKEPLVLAGITLAPAGTPVRIKITDARGAQSPDVDGSIDILFEPLQLANNLSLPLRTPTAHVTVRVTAGAESTAGIADTLKDIFIPYHYLYRLFRKGAEIDLRPGTVMRARTAATVNIAGTVASVVAPPPFHLSVDAPHAHFSPLPFYTVAPKKTLTPSPSPSAQATPSP